MNQEKIGNFIAENRKAKNLTQEQLAEKIGVTSKSISRWENGRTMPDYSILKSLCNELDVTINELLSGEKINTENYISKAEENFINLKKKVDRVTKLFSIIQIISTVVMVSIFIIHMYYNWLYHTDWDDSVFKLTSRIILYISMFCFFISGLLSYDIKENK